MPAQGMTWLNTMELYEDHQAQEGNDEVRCSHCRALCWFMCRRQRSLQAALTAGTNRAVAVTLPPPNSASRFVAAAGTGRMMSTEELRRLTRRIVDSDGAVAVSLSAPAAAQLCYWPRGHLLHMHACIMPGFLHRYNSERHVGHSAALPRLHTARETG